MNSCTTWLLYTSPEGIIIYNMKAKKYTIINLEDGTTLWVGKPKKGSDQGDICHYHFCSLYESVDNEEPIGTLGFSSSGTVSAEWSLDDDKTDSTLVNAVLIGLPYINLPVVKNDLTTKADGTFNVIKLLSHEQEPVYDKNNKLISITGYKSPREFIKQTVFKGSISDDKVKDLILGFANIERLRNEMGDGRFFSLNYGNTFFIDSSLVRRCFTELIDDGYIMTMGNTTPSGLPAYAKIAQSGRGILPGIAKRGTSATTTEIKGEVVQQYNYANEELIERLRELDSKPYFTLKLVQLLVELNDNHLSGNVYACHSLLRSILDHIPPIFDFRSFSAIADSYSWGKTDAAHMRSLKDFRNSADDALHKQISKRDMLLEMQGLPNHRALNVLLLEAIKLLEASSNELQENSNSS